MIGDLSGNDLRYVRPKHEKTNVTSAELVNNDFESLKKFNALPVGWDEVHKPRERVWMTY